MIMGNSVLYAALAAHSAQMGLTLVEVGILLSANRGSRLMTELSAMFAIVAVIKALVATVANIRGLNPVTPTGFTWFTGKRDRALRRTFRALATPDALRDLVGGS